MRKSLLLALFTVSLVCSLHATPAQAQRVFVGAAGSDSNLSQTHSLAEGNAFGVVSGGANATLWLAQSTVTGNSSAGFEALIGVINTFQDNYFSNNGPNIGSLAGVGKL